MLSSLGERWDGCSSGGVGRGLRVVTGDVGFSRESLPPYALFGLTGFLGTC